MFVLQRVTPLWKHTCVCKLHGEEKLLEGVNPFVSRTGQLSGRKWTHESLSGGVQQGNSRVNAAQRAQVLLEKAISKCKLFFSQLGCELSSRHQHDVGF